MGYSAYLALAPVVSLLSLAALAALFKYRAEPPARSLARFTGLSVLLVVLNALELLAPTERLTILFATLEHISFLLLPIAFAMFCLRYTGYDRYVGDRVRYTLIGLAAAQFVGVATNGFHGLFWRSAEFPIVQGLMTMRPSYGPLFWLAAAYAWALIAVGAVVVLKSYVAERGPYRTRSAAIVAGTLLPAAFNVAYLVRLAPGLEKDFTPIGYALGGLCFFAGAYLSRAARVIPLARGVVLQELDAGLVLVDPAGRLADFNAFAERLLGLSSAVLGRPVTSIAALDPVSTVLASASVSCEGVAVGQLALAGRSIVARAKRIGGAPGSGSPRSASRGVALMLSDVSERARLQDELDAIRSDLLKKEHFAVIGRLSADIAHEIANPLGYVQAEFKSIKALAAGAIGDERVRSEVFGMIKDAETGLSQIDRVARSLLEYASRGPGDEAAPAPYDLVRGVQNSLELTRSDYARVAVVDVDLEETPQVIVRGSEIDRVLLNILRNATEAVRERMAKTGALGRIWVRTRREGRSVVCEIGNDGEPFPDEKATRVFEEFFSGKGKHQGSGLGLSIAKNIVEKRHGGRLYLASRDPVTFRMELPMAEVTAPAP